MNLSLISVTAVGFHRLLLIFCVLQLVDSIKWLLDFVVHMWALKLMSWGLLWIYFELILDGYIKCVGCTFSQWAWMGFRLIVWVSSTHRFKIHKFPPLKFGSLNLDYPSQLIIIYMLQNISSCHHLRNNLISMLSYL